MLIVDGSAPRTLTGSGFDRRRRCEKSATQAHIGVKGGDEVQVYSTMCLLLGASSGFLAGISLTNTRDGSYGWDPYWLLKLVILRSIPGTVCEERRYTMSVRSEAVGQ